MKGKNHMKPHSNLAFRLSISGILISLGVVMSTFYIPIGSAKCFPIQHLINIVSAVLLGPIYAVMNAFIISVIRNMSGLGSLLAFPGSMIGAYLAGIVYQKLQNHRLACLGELVGTGIIGGMVASPFAIFLMGKEIGLFFFVLPFVLSSFVGSVLAFILLETTPILQIIRKSQRVNL